MSPLPTNFTRRQFIRHSGGVAALGAFGFPNIGKSKPAIPRILILGVDGMDPKLTMKLMQKGMLPNCRRLMSEGCFLPLRTTDPPQSPVAWSSFISGTNPGGHGIFDFIARDEKTLVPYLSTSRSEPPDHTLTLGKFSLPLGGSGPELLREGPTLWDLLADAGYDATAFRAPVSFPAVSKRAKTLAGITTPDLLGGYGTFTLFSTVPGIRSHEVAGGRILRVRLNDHRVTTVLSGPQNTYRSDGETVDIPLTIAVDPNRPLLRIDLSGNRVLLQQEEWSDWITLSFSMVPGLAETTGICRLYAKQVKPYLELYITPLNIDPTNPAMPISSPGSYARELVGDVGYFYTQGMPEDTAALSSGVFNDDQFRTQASQVLDERLRFLRHELNRYQDGFLYFYFSTLDLNSHAFWRYLDPGHPMHKPEMLDQHGDFLPELYRRIDEGIGWALEVADENTLLAVVSDHGFVSFRRQVQLNSWLLENGFTSLHPGAKRGTTSYFADTDWTDTQAYGVGINSLYINRKGREPEGTVSDGTDYEDLRTRLIDQLLAMRDPETGTAPIHRVLRREALYSGPYLERAPDLVVLYNEQYRASWDTILGAYPHGILSDNLDPWSGDHCMDSTFLPGVMICNRKISMPDPALEDFAPTILNLCKLDVPTEMTGRNLGVQ